jgi:AcrR family transcriptional regulator
MIRKRTVLSPENRRIQLLHAATRVFAQRGYRHTGVSDIIARAGVARGTFYLYFESKHQVFLAVVSAFHDQIAEALIDARADSDALERLAAVPKTEAASEARATIASSLRRWLEFFAANRDATTVVLREASSIDPRFEQSFLELRQSALDHFAARFRQLQELELVNPALSPEFVARLQLGMLDELINTFVLREADVDLGAIADQLAAFIWNGISQVHSSN